MYYCIVKKSLSFISVLPVMLILLLTALLCYFTTPIYRYLPLFIAAVGIIFAMIILPKLTNVEYEYNIEGDLFSVSVIRNHASRKTLFSSDISNLISCVPSDESDKNFSPSKRINASAGTNTLYTALFSEDETKSAVTFSPSDEFLDSLYLLAPRKVKRNILN